MSKPHIHLKVKRRRMAINQVFGTPDFTWAAREVMRQLGPLFPVIPKKGSHKGHKSA